MEWILWSVLAAVYVMCIFTVAMLTFRKGHTLLGILGIFVPFLWLIGAILPAKRGSRYWVDEGIRRQETMDELTR
jgi:hypothetical protein